METISPDAPSLIQRLRVSEQLTSRILEKIEIHFDTRALRGILSSDGSTVHAVVKNWVLNQMDAQAEHAIDPATAQENFARRLRCIFLEAQPDACKL